jgi:hypothetical protein
MSACRGLQRPSSPPQHAAPTFRLTQDSRGPGSSAKGKASDSSSLPADGLMSVHRWEHEIANFIDEVYGEGSKLFRDVVWQIVIGVEFNA